MQTSQQLLPRLCYLWDLCISLCQLRAGRTRISSPRHQLCLFSPWHVIKQQLNTHLLNKWPEQCLQVLYRRLGNSSWPISAVFLRAQEKEHKPISDLADYYARLRNGRVFTSGSASLSTYIISCASPSILWSGPLCSFHIFPRWDTTTTKTY